MPTTDDLTLTDEQHDFQHVLRAFLDDKVTSVARRAVMETDPGFDVSGWRQLGREIGLAGIAVPEEYGGLGLGCAEVAIAHEALGRSLYPGPFLATSLFTAGLLATGDGAAQSEWLPSIASTERIGAVAMSGRRGDWGFDESSVRATSLAGSWRVSGVRWYVIGGHVSDVLLVPVSTDDGPSLMLVEAHAPGLTTTVVPGLDLTRKISTVLFDHTPARLVGEPGIGHAVVDSVTQQMLVATAADAAGGIDWCLSTSVEHAKSRVQFGRPIGSFQAVAHTCVDMLAHLESARAASRYAAVATAEGAPDQALAARVAALRSGVAYRQVTEAAIHLLGGIGFTWEHDAHLYYRRAWSSQQLAGRPQAHRAKIAELVGL